MTDDTTYSAYITPEHREYLTAHAIDADLALNLGVRSVLSPADTADLGGLWVNWANFPALIFPWTNEAGTVEYQARPDEPTTGAGKKPRKYVFRKDMTPVLWAVRPNPDAATMLIVEGTKQGLAAATHAPADCAVYSIAGCRMWQIDGNPILDLMAADGRNVVVVLDADAATNPEVYKAGLELAEALDLEGAESVVFTRLPGGGKSGLDDVLAARPVSRRRDFLARAIRSAKPKPADAKPKPRRTAGQPTGDRVKIQVNQDRYTVINELTDALLKRWNATDLFNHGGVISRRRRGGLMEPVEKGTFHDLVQETAMTVSQTTSQYGDAEVFSWPDPGVMSATLSRADRFAALDRIAHAPYVRPDGTVVTEPGYDEVTKTLLMPDPVFEGIKVPEDPSPEEIAAARDLILTEWLGDFPLEGEADWANLLGLVVTPAIRGNVPRAPMAVIDGLQMGVGKNKIADAVHNVYVGSAASPMNFVDEHDELRKQITAAFRTGTGFFVFDEAHVLQGAALAQALTAETWQDRILGGSTMAYFPNRVTWISLGNNVVVKGDITRRVYRISIRPGYADPQDRPASSFRHPDLEEWTTANRRQLLQAILTLVRAWYAKGTPTLSKGVSFGSFERWEKVVGGIVETAGVPGFLGNIKTWRSESDFETQYWINHLEWLWDQFAGRTFRTAEVREKAITAGTDVYAAPPRMDDPTEKTYGKALGEAYSKIRGRRYGGFWMDRVGSAHGNVSVWQLHRENPTDAPPEVDTPKDSPQPVDKVVETATLAPSIAVMAEKTDIEEDIPLGAGPDGCTCAMSESSMVNCSVHGYDVPDPDLISSDAHVVTFDLETGDADDLYRADPETYVRIGATASDDGPVQAYTPGDSEYVAQAVHDDIWRGRTITGHNIMAFDLPALVRAGTITMPEIHRMAEQGRLFDAMIVARYLDPPMARDKGVDADRKYDLETLAEKHGLGEKQVGVSKALAKKYGGFGNIPIDDSEDGRAFKAYMVQDVELSRKLYRELSAEAYQAGAYSRQYLRREHRIAAIAAQISMNGFRVDRELLAERVAGVEQVRRESLTMLAEKYGLPMNDAKGKPYKSPLASRAGKEAVVAALVAAGVPESSIWRTPKSKDPQLSSDAMLHYGREYHHLPAVAEVARAVHKVVGSRSIYHTISDHVCPDGRVHPGISFKQATGRWSLTKPGLTVIGKRGGRHIERAVFLPDPGEVIIAADLSQVDMRAVAGLSQDQGYIEMLKTEDPHGALAVSLFGGIEFREQAKAIGHGWNYGESLRRISEDNDIDPKLVRRFDESMRQRFPRLVEWREEVRALAGSGALLDNGFGRLMRPDPARAHTQGPALMGQGAARDIMMEWLLRLPAVVLPMLRAQVHDELVASVPADRVEEISQMIIEASSFEWRGVPITADVSRPGDTWSMCYEKG